MRRELLISLLSILLLISSANLLGCVNRDALTRPAKTKSTKTSLSTAFSSSSIDIELAAFQLIVPVQVTVIEKRQSFYGFLSTFSLVVKANRLITSPGRVVAIVAANDYKLLFPFHHFW
jgi:hypothetical protein